MVKRGIRVYIAFLLVGLLCAVITCQARILGQHKVLPGPPVYSAQKITQLMQHHGTYVAWADNEGIWYFYRGNKICILYDPA